jgi:hypothetical protein
MINKKRAFSLVELSIIVAVIGIITFPMVEYLSALDRLNSYKETRIKIRTITDALTIYYKNNSGTLPYPADPTLSLDNVNAFRGDPEAITISASGGDVAYGAIPVYELGLSADHLLDGFGNKFSYYVTSSLNTISGSSGTIMVKNFDINGSENDSASYVIISHGHDGKGAFNRNGSQNSYADASSNEQNNIYKIGMNINTSNRLNISSGAIDDISMDSKKYDVISGYEGVEESGYTRFGSNLNFLDNGNVGIATTNPLSGLTVAGQLTSYLAYSQQGIHMGHWVNNWVGVELHSASNDGGSLDFLKLNSGNSDFQGRIKFFNSTAEERMSFYTNNVPRMHLFKSGNVTIGDDKEWQKLNVNGWITLLPLNGGVHWGLNTFGGSGDNCFIQYYNEGGGENTKLRIFISNEADDDIEFYQAGQARMQLDSGKIKLFSPLVSNSNIYSLSGSMTDEAHGEDFATFSHRQSTSATGYGLLQHYSGDSYVNSITTMNFRSANVDVAQLFPPGTNSNGHFILHESDERFFSVTDVACSEFGCDGSFKRYGGQFSIIFDDDFYVRKSDNDSVGINLNVDQFAVYAVNYHSPSDMRWKENIRPMGNILNKIMKLKPIIYDNKKNSILWVDKDEKYNKNLRGFIAQQVKPYFPDILDKNLEGVYSINSEKLTVISFKAVQEYKKEIDEDIEELNNSVTNLLKRISQFEND